MSNYQDLFNKVIDAATQLSAEIEFVRLIDVQKLDKEDDATRQHLSDLRSLEETVRKLSTKRQMSFNGPTRYHGFQETETLLRDINRFHKESPSFLNTYEPDHEAQHVFTEKLANFRSCVHDIILYFVPEEITLLQNQVSQTWKKVYRLESLSEKHDLQLEEGVSTLKELSHSESSKISKQSEMLKAELEQNALSLMRKELNNAKKSISEFGEGANDRCSEIIAGFDDRIEEKIESIGERINQEVSEFKQKRIEVEKVLGNIGDAYQADANRTQADKEKKAADWLRIIGTTGLSLVIVFSLYLFRSYLGIFEDAADGTPPDTDLTPQWFLVRFLTISLLTTPFIYLLKEASDHRSKEDLYRQRGTQLSSIGAYLSELSKEERGDLKKELASNFFTLHNPKQNANNAPDIMKSMQDAVALAKSFKSVSESSTHKADRTEQTSKQ